MITWFGHGDHLDLSIVMKRDVRRRTCDWLLTEEVASGYETTADEATT